MIEGILIGLGIAAAIAVIEQANQVRHVNHPID